MAKASPANCAARLTSCSDAEKKSGEMASPVVGLRARKAAPVPAPSVNPIIDCPESFIESTANRILESRPRGSRESESIFRCRFAFVWSHVKKERGQKSALWSYFGLSSEIELQRKLNQPRSAVISGRS